MPETRAGQSGTCPQCMNKLTVPQASAPEPAMTAEASAPSARVAATPLDEALLDRPPKPPPEHADVTERQRELEAVAQLGFTTPPEHDGQRQWSWPVDILLYPANMAGLTTLAIVAGIPLLLDLVARVPLLGSSLGLLSLIIRVVIWLFAGWYFAECVYDSAKGGTRAPEVLGGASLGDMRSRVVNLLAVAAVFAFPAGLYHLYTGKTDGLFWGLLAWAILFTPMGVLAMVLHDEASALNPMFLLGSIVSTLIPYLGLLLLIAGLAAVFWLTFVWPERIPLVSGFLWVVGPFVSNYFAFVLAHLLGRFYWRYRERLDWGL